MIIFTKVYNHKKRLRKDGTAYVYIRAYYNAKNLHINTGVRITPEAWAQRLQRVFNHPKATYYNKKINTLLHKLETYALDYEQQHGVVPCLEKLKEIAQGKKETQTKCLLVFLQDYITKDRAAGNITYGTWKGKRTVLRKLRQFRASIPFKDITYKLIKEFDYYLKSYRPIIKQNTIAKHHTILKSTINAAIKLGYLDKNPYLKFKIKKEKVRRVVLTPQELRQLEQLELVQNSAEAFVRDAFLFAAYTSLRFGDVRRLQSRNLRHSRAGTYLCYTAEKTGKYIELPIDVLFDGKPLDIFTRRLSNNPDAFVFGAYTNQYANRALKELAQRLSIKKNITTHTARHTFATTLASKVPTPVLQQIMQHSDIRTTMIYVQMSNKIIKDSIQNIQW